VLRACMQAMLRARGKVYEMSAAARYGARTRSLRPSLEPDHQSFVDPSTQQRCGAQRGMLLCMLLRERCTHAGEGLAGCERMQRNALVHCHRAILRHELSPPD